MRGALDRGADALAMAGGDGSQAIVAAIAAERGLPYACIPAGTRNHFALDLGVDRDDVVGALDAFVDGGERIVDLAEVNGRVFVNNVSLGLYAEAVQREEYRDAKLRTLLDTVPDVLGPDGDELDLRWTGPGGQGHHAGAMVLVSNNRYRLGRAVGSGTRPRIDDGLLGITVVAEPTGRGEGGRRLQRPLRAWSAPTFEVDADRPIAAGIDGEALALDPPLNFASGPASCACASRASTRAPRPRRMVPEGMWAGVAELDAHRPRHRQQALTSTIDGGREPRLPRSWEPDGRGSRTDARRTTPPRATRRGRAPLLEHIRRVAPASPRTHTPSRGFTRSLEHTAISEQELLAEGLTTSSCAPIRLLSRSIGSRSTTSYLAHVERIARAAGPGADIARAVKRADLGDRVRHPSTRPDGWAPPYALGLGILERTSS